MFTCVIAKLIQAYASLTAEDGCPKVESMTEETLSLLPPVIASKTRQSSHPSHDNDGDDNGGGVQLVVVVLRPWKDLSADLVGYHQGRRRGTEMGMCLSRLDLVGELGSPT